MAKSKIKRITAFLEKCLRERNVHISKIVLFGSHAKGRAGKESDVDIIVISDDFCGKNIFERVQLIKDAEIRTIKRFMVPLDIITLTSEEFEGGASLISDYARDGEVVYTA